MGDLSAQLHLAVSAVISRDVGRETKDIYSVQ